MLSLFCCFFLLFGQSLASPSANQYVDNILYSTLQNVIRNERLDPTPLSDYTYEYKDKTFIGTVKGRAEYTNGQLTGLSKVQRYSECDGPRNVSDGSTVIHCTITFNSLTTTYDAKVKYGVLPKVSISPKGEVRFITVDVDIAKGFNEGSAKVKSFNLISTGMFFSTFTGLGPLNNQMRVLERNYKEQVGGDVVSVVSNEFQYALNSAVGQVPMPLQ